MKDLTVRERKVIRKVAKAVRAWAEQHANANSYYGFGHLSGLCAICSARIWKALKSQGIRARLALAHGHVFVMYKEYVIDVTATQFGGEYPKILFRRHSTIRTRDGYWTPIQIYNSARMLRKRQNRDGWPEEQKILPKDV